MRVSSVVRCALYAHCSVVDKFFMSWIPFGAQYSRIPFIFKSSSRNFKKFQIIKEKGLVVSEIYVYLLCTIKTEKMKVEIEWCLNNLKKAYRIHSFSGNIDQFERCLIKAKEQGIEYTKDIPEEIIDSILNNP